MLTSLGPHSGDPKQSPKQVFLNIVDMAETQQIVYETTFCLFLGGPSFEPHFEPLSDLHLAPFWETYVAKANTKTPISHPKKAFEGESQNGTILRTPL